MFCFIVGVFFCCILENFSMFSAHAIFSYLFNFFGSNVGFRTGTHTKSSTLSFSDLAIIKCDSSSNFFIGSIIIIVYFVLLPSSSKILHLMKPSQRRCKPWSSAAIKNRFLLLRCDGDNCNVFTIFPQKSWFFLGFTINSKLYENSKPNKQSDISILVARNSKLLSQMYIFEV